jgi:predicted acetyltransferase
MTRPTEIELDRVTVLPASLEQMPILANLLELYAHDFSEFIRVEIGSDGRFGYNRLPLYWTDADRRPFLIRVNGRLAGLILVNKGSEVSGNKSAWDIAEFFILRGYRKRGVGTQAAQLVWKQLPGQWEVRVMEANALALRFWANAISEFKHEKVHPRRIEKDAKYWQLFSFRSD